MKSDRLFRRARVAAFALAGVSLISLAFARTFDAELNVREGASRGPWEFAGWSGGGCFPSVEFDPQVKGRVYLISDVAGIWRSDDLGERWEFINRGLDNTNVAALAVSASNSEVLYAATQGGLFVSENAGARWTAANDAGGHLRFERPKSHRPVAVHPSRSGTILAGTRAGGVFLSDDSGRTWKTLGGTQNPFGQDAAITAVALEETGAWTASKKGISRYSFSDNEWRALENAPGDVRDLTLEAGALYAAAGNAVWRSRDQGESWARLTPTLQTSVTRVSVSRDGETLGAVWERGWEGGVLTSADGGRTWKRADQLQPDPDSLPIRAWQKPGGRTTSVRVHPTDPRVLFRTDWFGVWRSENGGRDWHEKVAGAANIVGSDIALDSRGSVYVGAMDNGLLRSSDQGRSYQAVFPSTAYRKEWCGHVWRVAVSKDGRRVVGTSSPWNEDVNQVIVSEDGGDSFMVARNGLPARRPRSNTVWEQGYARALAVRPDDFDTMYLGIDGDDGGGLFVSRDGGKNWSCTPAQPPSKRIYNALALDPADGGLIYWGTCGREGGLFRSKDAGQSWQRVLSQLSCVFDCAVGPDGTVYAAGDQNGAVVYISRDRGETWTLARKFSGSGTAEALAVHPTRPEWVAVSVHRWNHQAGGRIFLSRDGGALWDDITGDLPDGPGAAAMAFSPREPYLYMTRYAGATYRKRI